MMWFLPREEGQSLLEYGLLIVLIGIVVIAALTLVGQEISELFSTIVNAL